MIIKLSRLCLLVSILAISKRNMIEKQDIIAQNKLILISFKKEQRPTVVRNGSFRPGVGSESGVFTGRTRASFFLGLTFTFKKVHPILEGERGKGVRPPRPSALSLLNIYIKDRTPCRPKGSPFELF